jgi:hypothetical protein
LGDQLIVQGMDGSPLPHVDEVQAIVSKPFGLKIGIPTQQPLEKKSCCN